MFAWYAHCVNIQWVPLVSEYKIKEKSLDYCKVDVSLFEGICSNGQDLKLIGYVKIEFVVDRDGILTTDYIFSLATGAVDQMSRLQSMMALSITEIEYIVVT